MKSIKKKKIATKKKPSRKLPAKKPAAARNDPFEIGLLNALDSLIALLHKYQQQMSELRARLEALETASKYNQPQQWPNWPNKFPPPYAPYEYGTADNGPQYVDYATAIYGRAKGHDGAKKNGA